MLQNQMRRESERFHVSWCDMRVIPPYRWLMIVALAIALAGCRGPTEPVFIGGRDTVGTHLQDIAATQLEVAEGDMPIGADVGNVLQPRTVHTPGPVEFQEITLKQCIEMALQNNKIIRDIGGRIVGAPAGVSSAFDPALQETDLRSGVEQALALYDASFSSSINLARNERTFNNSFFGGGTRQFLQNTGEFRMEIEKRAMTGTVFSARSITNYDRNNSPQNLFPSAWDQQIEAEIRHPFLQAGGVLFNQIAGGQARPGFYNGVLIARINMDISIADFEIATRQLIYDVERSYWGLYGSYRELDSVVKGRDRVLEIWRRIKTDVDVGRSKPEREALVREQYYEAQIAVENSLNGTPGFGSSVTFNIFNPITAQQPGVFGNERRLRFLIGMPNTDGKVLRPVDSPPGVHVVFDWEESLATALTRRVELRRQRWAVKRRELELVAANNFLMGRLDGVARAGIRGFGDKLFGDNGTPNNSAFQDLSQGNLEQWELGLQYQTLIGNRLGYTAVKNAELQLIRERALYRVQEDQIVHEVEGLYQELERAHSVARTSFNRRISAAQNLEPVYERFLELGERRDGQDGLGVSLEFLLDAQRRSIRAEAEFYQSLVNHVISVSLMHYYRGTYLDYHNIHLAEGPWTEEAHISAEREARKFRDRRLKTMMVPAPVSQGVYPQGEQDGVLAPPKPKEGETIDTPAPNAPGAPVPPAGPVPPGGPLPPGLVPPAADPNAPPLPAIPPLPPAAAAPAGGAPGSIQLLSYPQAAPANSSAFPTAMAHQPGWAPPREEGPRVQIDPRAPQGVVRSELPAVVSPASNLDGSHRYPTARGLNTPAPLSLPTPTELPGMSP